MTISISSPASHNASPLRSSPLSKPPLTAERPSSPATRPPLPIPNIQRESPAIIANGASISPVTPVIGGGQSASPHGSTPSQGSTPLSRSHPLLGSFPVSLLHSRMSQHAPHSAPAGRFALQLRAIGKGRNCPRSLRAPEPLNLPFAATYYDLVSGPDEPVQTSTGKPGGPTHSPWVANVDIEGHYFETLSSDRSDSGAKAYSPCNEGSPPAYPGYRVAPVGQLQILIRTVTSPVKIFVLQYDLRPLTLGGRLLAREREYQMATHIPSGSQAGSRSTREVLRYAVQLQFVCTSAPADENISGNELAFYIGRTMRLVFSGSPTESNAEIRTERTDEIVPPHTKPLMVSRSPPHSPSRLSCTPASSGTSSPNPDNLQRISEEWGHIRSLWVSNQSSTVVNDRERPERVHGFSPEPSSRPTTPSAPANVSSPRSLLSALAPDQEEEDLSKNANRAAPIPGRNIPQILSPISQRIDIRRRRGSKAERELSERLRAMEMSADEGFLP